jgi:hypothetical protein
MIHRTKFAIVTIALFLSVTALGGRTASAESRASTPRSVSPFDSSAGFVGVTPFRLLDTREGNGAPQAPLGSGGSIDLQVAGRGGVPTDGVGAVVLNVTAINPSESGYVTAWPTGDARPTASNLNFVGGQTVPNLVIVKVGVGGRVSLYNFAGTVDLAADVTGYYTTSSQLVPVTPRRLLDTRSGLGGVAGPTTGKVDVQVVGQAGIPVGAASVVLNVTVDQPTSSGYLTVWPTGYPQPNASNLNFVAGQTVPNVVFAKVGREGKISYFNNSGRVHVIIDVLGYTSTATDLTELLDRVSYSDYFGFPEVTANVQGSLAFDSLRWPGELCGLSTPEWVEYNLGRQWGTLSTTLTFDDASSVSSSSVRFRVLGDGNELVNRTVNFGEAVPVTLNVSGVLRVRFEVLNLRQAGCSADPTFATPRLDAAPNAGFAPNPEFSPLVPVRILDTRDGTGAGKGRVPAGGTVDLQVLGRGGVPAVGVGAVVMNLTVTEPDASGYLTAYPSGQPLPTASNVNFVSGQTVPNLVVVPVGPNGRVSIYNFGGPAHIIGDLLGWYVGNVDARATSADLTELLDRVSYSDYFGFPEVTANVQGSPAFNSLRWPGDLCGLSTPEWVEYNLGRQWSTLSTTLAFDDQSSVSSSSVRFRVLGDGNELVNRTVNFGDAVPVTLNVSGVLRVRFEVLNLRQAGCSNDPTFATPHLSR